MSNKKKKGRTLPMSQLHSNGNGPSEPGGIPADLVWDEENPPIIFECSQDIVHETPDCECEGEVCTESQVNLLNESKAWARAGMDKNMLQTDSFSTASQVNALQQVLVKHGIVSQDEIDEEFRKIKYDVLRSAREQIQPQIEAMRRQAAIGIPKQGLINPFEQ